MAAPSAIDQKGLEVRTAGGRIVPLVCEIVDDARIVAREGNWPCFVR